MIDLSPEARANVRELSRAYADLGRSAAVRNLATVVVRAGERIERNPGAGLPAPRPYPKLARPGRAWIKEGAYWIAYTATDPPVITGVFHERADIPGRAG